MDRGGGVAKRDHDLFENRIAIDVWLLDRCFIGPVASAPAILPAFIGRGGSYKYLYRRWSLPKVVVVVAALVELVCGDEKNRADSICIH